MAFNCSVHSVYEDERTCLVYYAIATFTNSLCSTLQCPPPFLQESTGMGLKYTGIGPESAGIHQNGTSKVQHSGYSPNGIW